MNTTMILVALLLALVIGIFIGAKFGRIILLAGLVGVGMFVLVNLPKIVGMVEKAQAIARVLGW
jgi:hypothetical protein